MQQPATIIEVRPYRRGCQSFKAPGVHPYWVGNDAKQSALDYAKARAKYGRDEIRMLNPDGQSNTWLSSTNGALPSNMYPTRVNMRFINDRQRWHTGKAMNSFTKLVASISALIASLSLAAAYLLKAGLSLSY